MKKLLTFCFILTTLALPFASKAQLAGKNPILFTHHNNGWANGIGVLPTQPDDLPGRLQFMGWISDGDYHAGAEISSTAIAPILNNGYAGDLRFSTGFPLTSRMRITADGLVGIGTDLPTFNLEVVGNTHTTGDFYGRIHFDDNGSGDDGPDTYEDEAYFELHGAGAFSVLPVTTSTDGGLLTLAPGGASYDHQLYFADDGIFHRAELNNAVDWTNAWERLLTTSDISGTQNFIAKFTDTNSLGDSQLWDDGTQVGIRTSTPNAAYDVDINGDTRNDGDLDVTGAGHFDGKVSIGTTNTPGGHSLYVQGTAIAEEVIVKLEGSWPDYVFADDYQKQSLEETATAIEALGHLPGIPSAREIEENGLELGDISTRQMEKIEELYLHMIEMNRQMQQLQEENQDLKERLTQLEAKQ